MLGLGKNRNGIRKGLFLIPIGVIVCIGLITASDNWWSDTGSAVEMLGTVKEQGFTKRNSAQEQNLQDCHDPLQIGYAPDTNKPQLVHLAETLLKEHHEFLQSASTQKRIENLIEIVFAQILDPNFRFNPQPKPGSKLTRIDPANSGRSQEEVNAIRNYAYGLAAIREVAFDLADQGALPLRDATEIITQYDQYLLNQYLRKQCGIEP